MSSFKAGTSSGVASRSRMTRSGSPMRLPNVSEREARVLDDPERVAERIPDRRHADSLADVPDLLVERGAELQQPAQLRRGVVDAPVRDDPRRRRPACDVRIQA